MGYDMELREPTLARPTLPTPPKNGDGKIDDAARERFVAEWKAWEDDGNYFRANIWSMGVLRSLLFRYGLLTELGRPSWPSGRDADTTDTRAQRAPSDTAVGAWKFGSNDGWIVTPDECLILSRGIETALASADFEPVLAELLADRADDIEAWEQYIGSFGEFCWNAAQHGGFEVW